MRNIINTKNLLWFVYICLLAVLFPHTAWLFSQFEPENGIGSLSAWAASFAFEAAIAVLTYRLARHIETTPRRFSNWQKFKFRYLNAYSFGLVSSVVVSALANLAHSVQFGRDLSIFAAWGVPSQVYQVAFGGILPIVSLLFARVLSNVVEEEEGPSPEEAKANAALAGLRSELVQAKAALADAEARAQVAEERFAAAGDIMYRLFAGEKRERILAARQQWPQLSLTAVAMIAGSSVSYASEVLSSESAMIETE